MTSKLPNPSAGVFVCVSCHHWQCDIPNSVRQELGGSRQAVVAVAEANAEHLAECVGQGGRVKVLGQWVERPTMSSGNQADGVCGFFPFPRWWRVQ